MSIKCLLRHPGYFYVSCSLSKIPYVGFSPIRLQTGIQPRSSQTYTWLKLDDSVHHTLTYLYVVKALNLLSSVALYEQLENGMYSKSYPVQRPLAHLKVMLSLWILAYYGLIRDTRPSCRLILLRPTGLCPAPSYGLVSRASPICSAYLFHRAISRTPTFHTAIFDCYYTVCSGFHLLCRGSANVTHARWFSHGSVTRLQSSLYATARWIACPPPARTFTFELSPLESPQSGVEYNYTGKQSIPVTGLSPARYAALWAANKEHSMAEPQP